MSYRLADAGRVAAYFSVQNIPFFKSAGLLSYLLLDTAKAQMRFILYFILFLRVLISVRKI